MTRELHQSDSDLVSRRSLIKAAVSVASVAAGVAALAPGMAFAQTGPAQKGTPPSVITNPPRQWVPGSEPETYPDPDIIQYDPAFGNYMLYITAMHRLWTGSKWAEGPAWSAQGNYMVFSDVQGNVQYRLIWDDMRVTKFRDPSFNSNGNSFDFQGRQISTQDFNRRVVRWENDGSMTVIADSFNGKGLNSPNDLVPHPDGSIWFTDPPFGDSLSEGHPDFAGGKGNPEGKLNPTVGAENAGAIGGQKQENPPAIYRWDPSGRLDLIYTGDGIKLPNGICFSPDYKTLYIVNSADGSLYQFDVADGKATNLRLFSDCMVDGIKCGPDGLRADVDGNLWSSSNSALGYSGLLAINPAGKIIGRLRTPEVVSNVVFGGPKRNFLLMTGSQSIYALQVQTQGAAPG
jgi:gluconolactonase